MTITIPFNTNSGIRIPARTTPVKPERKLPEPTSRISVSIQEAAKILGVSKKTFYPLIREGKVRTVKIGRRVLVSVQSLHEFVDGKKESCNPTEKSEDLQGGNA
jgi:excisionase family DNA binding protein